MSWTRILAGAIFLALLDAFLTNRAASSNVGGAETALASGLAKFLDPAVPAFSSSSTTTAAAAASGSSGAPLGPSGTLGPLGPLGPIAPSHPTTTPAGTPAGP